MATQSLRHSFLLFVSAALALAPAQTGLNPLAAYFRDAEAAYALLPPVDMGFDNVAAIRKLDKKLLVFQFDQREPWLEVPIPAEENQLRGTIFDPVTHRKTPITGMQFLNLSFEILAYNGDMLLLGWTTYANSEWSTKTYVLSLTTGRAQLIDKPQIGAASFSDSGRLLAIVSGQTIVVYDRQGNFVREQAIPNMRFADIIARRGIVISGRREPGTQTQYFRYDIDGDRMVEMSQEEFRAPYERPYEPSADLNGFLINRMPHSGDFLDGEAGGLVSIGTYLAAKALQSEEPESPLPHERPRYATVTGGASDVMLFNEDRIMILQSRRLLERKIEKIDLEQYKLAVIEDIKRKAMGQAKQLGTAAHIYAADYDDRFPPSGDWQSMLGPYMRNNSLFQNAVFTTNGEKASEIEKISEYVMGWVQTPYGRAIIRGDSSIRWSPNP